MPLVRQWDIVRLRIRPDGAEHPAVVISGEEWCTSDRTFKVNVLAGTKRVPGDPPKPYQVVLNSADGLEFQTLLDCRFFHILAKDSVKEISGRVSPERRCAIGRKINEVLRLRL